jgi:hypothetical protein
VRRWCVVSWSVAAIVIAACSGRSLGLKSDAGESFSPSASATCGPPPPVPFQPLYLSYPAPHARSVPLTIKELVFAGWDTTFFGKDVVNLVRLNDDQPIGVQRFRKFVPAPSPLPSPRATPPWSGSLPYVAVAIPDLKPTTRYVVSYTYKVWSDKPPSCRTSLTKRLGGFKTGP